MRKTKLFIESIKRDPATLAKFNKHIKDSQALREESGIDLETHLMLQHGITF